MMKKNKIVIFLLSIMGYSAVLFNNITQIIHELWTPQFNFGAYFGLGISVLASIIYIIFNSQNNNKKVN